MLKGNRECHQINSSNSSSVVDYLDHHLNPLVYHPYQETTLQVQFMVNLQVEVSLLMQLLKVKIGIIINNKGLEWVQFKSLFKNLQEEEVQELELEMEVVDLDHLVNLSRRILILIEDQVMVRLV